MIEDMEVDVIVGSQILASIRTVIRSVVFGKFTACRCEPVLLPILIEGDAVVVALNVSISVQARLDEVQQLQEFRTLR